MHAFFWFQQKYVFGLCVYIILHEISSVTVISTSRIPYFFMPRARLVLSHLSSVPFCEHASLLPDAWTASKSDKQISAKDEKIRYSTPLPLTCGYSPHSDVLVAVVVIVAVLDR